ncbi:hypothetical protein C8Q79DRAFT_1006173 [Trametes meyenii]|nr:hypothetical protein C8Q79DRAFT_1006173 [Trametes meyenii]
MTTFCTLLDEEGAPGPLIIANRSSKSASDILKEIKDSLWDLREYTHRTHRDKWTSHPSCAALVADKASPSRLAAAWAATSESLFTLEMNTTGVGADDEVRDGQGKHFGRKLETIIELFKSEIPNDERILNFV